MADENKAEVTIGAKIDEAVAAIGQLQNQFTQFSKHVSDKMKETNTVLDQAVGYVKRYAAAVLSLAAVRKAIDETKEWTLEVQKLSRVLGEGATDATAIAVAIGDVHGTTDEAVHIMQYMARQARENSDSMERWGLKVTDSNGKLKSQKQLFLESIEVINGYKAGTDRNIAATALWGRSALEHQAMLKLTAAAIEEAREKAERLGLTITQEDLQATADWRAAMQDVHDVMMGWSKMVGTAFMPVATEIANFFSSTGAESLKGFSVAIKIVASGVNGLALAFEIAYEIIKAAVQSIVVAVIGFSEAFDRAIHLDFKGAYEAQKRSADQIVDIWKGAGDKIMDASVRARQRLANLWDPSHTPTEGPAPGGKTAPIVDPNLMAKLEAELSLRKANFEAMGSAAGQFYNFSLQQEKAYWEQYVNDARLKEGERLRIRIKVLDLESKIAKERFAAQIEESKAEEAQYSKNLDERLRVVLDRHAKIVAAFGEESKEAKASGIEVANAYRQISDRQIEIYRANVEAKAQMQLKEIDITASGLDRELGLKRINVLQSLDMERSLERQRLEIKKSAIDQQVELAKSQGDTAKVNELNNQKLALEKDFQLKMTDIDKRAALEQAKYQIQAREMVQGAFSNFFYDLMDKTSSLREKMKSLFMEILRGFERIIAAKFAENLFGPGTAGGEVVDMIVKPITTAISSMTAGWFTGQEAMTAASAAGETEREGLTAASAAAAIAAAKLEAISQITSYAAIAGAGAMASVAAIPVVGWAMAPGVGAETYLTALSYIGAAFSAAGGFDIPGGVNPVTQLHQKEMVLPENLAERVRNMTGDGGGKVAFVGDIVDSDSIGRFMRRRSGPITQALQEKARRFGYLGGGPTGGNVA